MIFKAEENFSIKLFGYVQVPAEVDPLLLVNCYKSIVASIDCLCSVLLSSEVPELMNCFLSCLLKG